MGKNFATALAFALLAAGLAGCTEQTSAAPADPNTVTVEVSDMKFAPASVTINAGQSISWNFDDRGVAHDVVGTGNAATLLHSPLLAAGQYSQTFSQPGTYSYYCTIHPDMLGTITVR